jgi:hypothetical protein
MWTVIYVASTLKIAESVKEKLEQEGFLVKLEPLGSSRLQYELLVPSAEIEEVREVLPTVLGMR